MNLRDSGRLMATAAFVTYVINLDEGSASADDTEAIQHLMDTWNALGDREVAVWRMVGRQRVPVFVARSAVTD